MSNELNGQFMGGWKFTPNLQACDLLDDVATGFGQIFDHMVGATYVPLLYVGTQLVHGTNHMLICKQTLAVKDGLERLVCVVLNQNFDDGTILGQWSLVSIEPIVTAH